jgi:hypothetical protein
MKKKFLLLIAFFVAGFNLAEIVLAQSGKEQPVQEVFQTETVYPQERGEFQLTMGYTLRKQFGRSSAQLPVFLEYGVTDKWQIGFQWNALNINNAAGDVQFGTGDLSLGTKYSFMNVGNSNTHVALGFELGLPSGDRSKEMSEGQVEYEPFVVIAKDFPQFKHLQIFTQVGLGIIQRPVRVTEGEDKEPVAHELNWNTGFFIPLQQWVITTEFHWSTNRWNHGGTDNHRALTPGVIWRTPANWEIGVGAPISLTQDSPESRLIFKLTKEF